MKNNHKNRGINYNAGSHSFSKRCCLLYMNPALKYPFLLVLFLSITICAESVNNTGFSNFITRHNDTLFDGDTIFRFISFNVPNLHLLEDNFPFTEENNWTLPTTFEIRDAMQSVKDAGGTVIRQYCFRIHRSHEPDFLPKHVTAHRQYYEPSFKVMDTVLTLANEYGIRLIIPFLEGPVWWGPKKEFARLHGHNNFEHPQIREDYKHLISYIVNRRNTVTGTLYKNDKAILCWETGNEMGTSASLLKEISAYVKSIDSNHLLMDGNYGIRKAALNDSNVDIVSNHFYNKPSHIIAKDLKRTCGKKAYIIGEWGFSLEKCSEVLNQTLQSTTASALIWSLRYRYRDGGFTWHRNQGLHWPGGFARSENPDEKQILDSVRAAAFTIRNLSPTAILPPEAPTLLPIAHPSYISWQGSTRALWYSVERTDSIDTAWITVGDSVDETEIAYRPLFSDTLVTIGMHYYYRVIAHGPGGISLPSNTVGPVIVTKNILVDEFQPGKIKYSTNNGTSNICNKPWLFKYDFHRQQGAPGCYLEYKVEGTITAVRLYTFFRKRPVPFTQYIADSTGLFTPEPMRFDAYPYCCANPQDHLRLPVLFSSDSLLHKGNRVRIYFPDRDAQIGRCEIEYLPGGQLTR